MARGNVRQDIVHDEDDRHRLTEDLEGCVIRSEWSLLAYVFMRNHLHILVRTPRPNLGRGMQRFLSSYSQWNGRRRGRAGHLFQGRYRAEMIEDEAYYWSVSRYIHLNPVRAGLVERPEEWPWSSYRDYVTARQARNPYQSRPWIATDELLAAWTGEFGGSDPVKAYRRYVEAGVAEPPESPFRESFGGWILGSRPFVERLRGLAGPAAFDPTIPEARQLASLEMETICEAVARYYKIEPESLTRRYDKHIARAMVAGLCRRYTETPLRELAERLGLSRADSVPNLTRRLESRLETSPRLARDEGDHERTGRRTGGTSR